jgi:hypothetical protein
MKKACFLFILLTFALTLSAQDMIIRTNGETINCKITKIDTADVFFTILSDGVEIHTSLAKSEIQSMKFGTDNQKQDYDATESKPVVVPSSQGNQTDTNYSKPKRKVIEGTFYLGCTLPTWQGDVDMYAGDLSDAMYYSSGMDFDFKPGIRLFPIDIGMGLGINVTSWFTIQAGLELAPKGMMYRGKATYDDVDYKMQVTYKTNYLEFPVGIMLSTRSWGKPYQKYFYVKGGIAPAINVLAKTRVYVYATDGYDSDSDSDTEDLEGVNKQDFCEYAAIGFGKKGGAALELKYEKGTRVVMKPDYSAYEFYNSSVTLNLLVTF